MKYQLCNAKVYTNGKFKNVDIVVDNGVIIDISKNVPDLTDAVRFDFKNYIILPGLIDVHVHLREPGFFYKETIKSGTAAAAKGGFCTVMSMPNLKPAPDTLENLNVQRDIIERDAVINVLPYGTITKGQNGKELSDMEEMADYVCAFSDDGRGVQNDDVMQKAMEKAASLGKIIAAHCEVNDLLFGGYIHDGAYAKAHGHKGICSRSEYEQIARDIELVKKTGVKYHVCHISTKESVEIIRKAKQEGVDITCETAPHYLMLCDEDIQEHGRFKMNPPLRSREDKQALLLGIADGTIDMIATDHAPHSAEEKSKGLAGSTFGVVGIETSFGASYTALVKSGLITLEQLVRLMHDNAARRFGVSNDIKVGNAADLAVFSVHDEYTVDSNTFLSMGKATPFDGMKLYGECIMNMCKGRITWQKNSTEK